MSDSVDTIGTIIATYAELMDNGDFDGLAALLSDAVIGVFGEKGEISGSDAILELFRGTVKIHDDGTPRTHHVTTNIQVEADDDAGTAVARSYFTVFQATATLPLQAIVAGRYYDRFLWRGGRWRFVERRFRTQLVGDVSQHLLSGPEVLKAPEAP